MNKRRRRSPDGDIRQPPPKPKTVIFLREPFPAGNVKPKNYVISAHLTRTRPNPKPKTAIFGPARRPAPAPPVPLNSFCRLSSMLDSSKAAKISLNPGTKGRNAPATPPPPVPVRRAARRLIACPGQHPRASHAPARPAHTAPRDSSMLDLLKAAKMPLDPIAPIPRPAPAQAHHPQARRLSSMLDSLMESPQARPAPKPAPGPAQARPGPAQEPGARRIPAHDRPDGPEPGQPGARPARNPEQDRPGARPDRQDTHARPGPRPGLTQSEPARPGPGLKTLRMGRPGAVKAEGNARRRHQGPIVLRHGRQALRQDKTGSGPRLDTPGHARPGPTGTKKAHFLNRLKPFPPFRPAPGPINDRFLVRPMPAQACGKLSPTYDNSYYVTLSKQYRPSILAISHITHLFSAGLWITRASLTRLTRPDDARRGSGKATRPPGGAEGWRVSQVFRLGTFRSSMLDWPPRPLQPRKSTPPAIEAGAPKRIFLVLPTRTRLRPGASPGWVASGDGQSQIRPRGEIGITLIRLGRGAGSILAGAVRNNNGRGGAGVARETHTLQVAGSSPAPAPNFRRLSP